MPTAQKDVAIEHSLLERVSDARPARVRERPRDLLFVLVFRVPHPSFC